MRCRKRSAAKEEARLTRIAKRWRCKDELALPLGAMEALALCEAKTKRSRQRAAKEALQRIAAVPGLRGHLQPAQQAGRKKPATGIHPDATEGRCVRTSKKSARELGPITPCSRRAG